MAVALYGSDIWGASEKAFGEYLSGLARYLGVSHEEALGKLNMRMHIVKCPSEPLFFFMNVNTPGHTNWRRYHCYYAADGTYGCSLCRLKDKISRDLWCFLEENVIVPHNAKNLTLRDGMITDKQKIIRERYARQFSIEMNLYYNKLVNLY